MSRVRKYSKTCDGGNDIDLSSTGQGPKETSTYLDHEISQLTNLRSGPHELLSRVVPGKLRLPVSTVKMLVGRESNYSGRGRFSSADKCHVLSRYLPVNGPWKVDKASSAYVSQFSADGSLFVAGFQATQIRIYNVDGGWKVQKDIRARGLCWTITDASLSPDQRYLVYASMPPVVRIINVGSAATESHANITEIHDSLDLSVYDNGKELFGIFTVKFSTDGRELVAGSTDDSIYVFDVEPKKLTLRIPAHMVLKFDLHFLLLYDVNTVCFADETGHLIYSGGDDNLCKVWDRRCDITKGQAAGVLTGHLEGIAFLDSRGDGHYFISNGKDQTIKLWDIRKMSSNATCQWFRYDGWDYRLMNYPPHRRNLKHPCDQSLATYKGHSVLRTLVRCYFSPAYSTGQKYIYTGSSDWCVYIYDLVSGAQVGKLDYHEGPVRDCSWHPFYPMIISSSWDGVIAKWEFPGSGETEATSSRSRRRPYQF